MARPCNSVDPEEHYRRLERLLAELYLVLRALLNQGAPLLPPNAFQPPPPPPPSQDESGSSSRRDRGGRPGRRRPPGGGGGQEGSHDRSGGGCGHQNQRSCHLISAPTCQSRKDNNWDRIGHNLKEIADTLKENRQSGNLPEKKVVEKIFDADPLLLFCGRDGSSAQVDRNKPYSIT